ncbi:hypothetical protein [uncultured Clostridium sp.]|uniref:hypothetical protein n=1 Tax=uncultured Clostridium sp. TaxID=59620 RepID=UPI0025F53006|nr:hypothetical protein [uncultured Clostridium sp.]
MKYMYIKYKSNMRESFTADKNIIRHDYTDIAPENISETYSITKAFAAQSDMKSSNNYGLEKQGMIINIEPYIKSKEKTINEEITQFFFDSIHKNHLKNRL